MPTRLTLLENILFLKMNQGPSPLFDLFGAGGFRAVAAGVKLGIFEAIGQSDLTTKEVASQIGCDLRATGILLEFLCSLGYLRKRSDRYENTGLSRKWILKDSLVSIKDMILVWDQEVFPFWDDNLESVLRKGKLEISIYQQFETKPEAWKSFNSFEMAIANWLADPLLSQVKLDSNKRRLLDVGGGHGLYSIMFCKKYPKLSATIFDREESLKVAQGNVDSAGLQERIELKKGDFLVDNLGEGYDIVFLFNILHNFRKEENAKILRNVYGALSPFGVVVVFDNFLGPGMSRTTIDFFSLAYLATVGGQCYTLAEVKEWLREAGFAHPKTTLRLPGLVRATKFQ